MKTHIRKERPRRKINYDRLKAVGFNSYEATRYKDFSDSRIDKMIAARINLNEQLSILSSR